MTLGATDGYIQDRSLPVATEKFNSSSHAASTLTFNSSSTPQQSLRFLPIPHYPFNYTVQGSPLRILVSHFKEIMPLDDTANIFRRVAFEIFAHMQLDPAWVMRPMRQAYGKKIGKSMFGIIPTTAMKYQDLGLVAAQLLIWQEFFGCYVEFDMVIFRRSPDDETMPIATGFLQIGPSSSEQGDLA